MTFFMITISLFLSKEFPAAFKIEKFSSHVKILIKKAPPPSTLSLSHSINFTYVSQSLRMINYLALVFMQRDCKVRENRAGDIRL